MRRFGIAVVGKILKAVWRCVCRGFDRSSTNGRDFGAFGAFLPVRMLLATHDATVHERIERHRVDEQGRGTYTWFTLFEPAPPRAEPLAQALPLGVELPGNPDKRRVIHNCPKNKTS